MDSVIDIENLAGLPDISVNGVAIPKEALVEEMRLQPGAVFPKTLVSIARTLIIQELLLQAARNLEGQARPEESHDEARVRVLLEQNVQVDEPTEIECREFFNRNQNRLGGNDLLEVSHILIGSHTKLPKARWHARKKAQFLIDSLQEKPRDFSGIAKKHSDCQSREVGGNLGKISRGQMVPEFERQVFSLGEGLSPEPIETRFGFHVVRVDRKVPGPPLSFEYVRGMIESYLAENRHRVAVRHYIDGLLSKADVQGIDIAASE